MLFTSPIFLFLFLPFVLLIYFCFPLKSRNLVLFISSLFFYAWGEHHLVIIMLISTITDYSCGLMIQRGYRKSFLTISIAVNVLLLVIFKYSNFLCDNLNALLALSEVDLLLEIPKISLPIGISFYTFQTMSYTIDVYRGRIQAQSNFIDFGAFVSLFPQLIAGPIVRYIDIEKKLDYIHRRFDLENFYAGSRRFIIGLAKKMLIANSFALLADNAFSIGGNNLDTLGAWIGIISYSFQIYFDFSAYSDMAIGLGKIFGFNIPENFNYPYISRSIQEFWRRWHISLSSWFKDYLYIPLGGNRKGMKRTYFNLVLVFFVTGIWHGASWTFVIWGLFHGLLLIIERLGFKGKLESVHSIFGHVYTLFAVLIAWVIFRAESFLDAKEYIGAMFGLGSGKVHYSYFVNPEILILFPFAIILSTPIYPYLLKLSTQSKSNFIDYGIQSAIVLLYFLSIMNISAGSYNPFIYFRF